MTATEPVSQAVTREELHAFHLTARGLDHLRAAPGFNLATAAELPPMESVFPVLLTPGKPPQPHLHTVGANALLHGPEHLAEFHASALPLLYGGFFTAGRAAARTRFAGELRQAVTNLQDLLAVDDAKLAPTSATRVAASLGADAPRFLSVSGLMAVWARHAGKPAAMPPDRRHRCHAALTILEEALRRQQESPAFWLFHSDERDPMELGTVSGLHRKSLDPCADALDFCEQQAQELTLVLRAMRLAKLETVSGYTPAVHDEALLRFDWQTAEPHEIAAIPGIIALESAWSLSLNSFSRLLRSGLPLQVLISRAEPEDDDPGATALAHHAAFVLQTSMARWDHLSKGFAAMAQTLSPAVAVVAVPAASEDPQASWREASQLARSQAFPLYQYNPDREGEWTDRFELCEASSDGRAELLLLSCRDDLRILPLEMPDTGLMDLTEYLKKPQDTSTLPFLAVTDIAGSTHRVALTRRMVRLWQLRSRAWEMLAALAATPKPADDLTSIRKEAAKDAYLRVVALLADPEKLVRRP